MLFMGLIKSLSKELIYTHDNITLPIIIYFDCYVVALFVLPVIEIQDEAICCINILQACMAKGANKCLNIPSKYPGLNKYEHMHIYH